MHLVPQRKHSFRTFSLIFLNNSGSPAAPVDEMPLLWVTIT